MAGWWLVVTVHSSTTCEPCPLASVQLMPFGIPIEYARSQINALFDHTIKVDPYWLCMCQSTFRILFLVSFIIYLFARFACCCLSGHVAESLQVTDPDVYVSSDGGYTWRFVSFCHLIICSSTSC